MAREFRSSTNWPGKDLNAALERAEKEGWELLTVTGGNQNVVHVVWAREKGE